jgi:hypothetical protein
VRRDAVCSPPLVLSATPASYRERSLGLPRTPTTARTLVGHKFLESEAFGLPSSRYSVLHFWGGTIMRDLVLGVALCAALGFTIGPVGAAPVPKVPGRTRTEKCRRPASKYCSISFGGRSASVRALVERGPPSVGGAASHSGASMRALGRCLCNGRCGLDVWLL